MNHKNIKKQPAPSDCMICLVRHGEIEGADLRRCIGRLDVPLSKKGYEEAHQAGKWLAKTGMVFSVWSSPLTRCAETAKAIQEELACDPVRFENDLAEMAAGEWEGMTFTEIQEKYPAEYEDRGRNLIHYQTPGGESFFDAGKRFLAGLQKILQTTGKECPAELSSVGGAVPAEKQRALIVVAHSGVIRSALCHLGAQSFEYMLCIPQPYGGVSILRAEQDAEGTWHLFPTDRIGVSTSEESVI